MTDTHDADIARLAALATDIREGEVVPAHADADAIDRVLARVEAMEAVVRECRLYLEPYDAQAHNDAYRDFIATLAALRPSPKETPDER